MEKVRADDIVLDERALTTTRWRARVQGKKGKATKAKATVRTFASCQLDGLLTRRDVQQDGGEKKSVRTSVSVRARPADCEFVVVASATTARTA